MKKKSIIFSLFVIVASANAQEGTNLASKPTIVPEFKKNEISINTAALFRVLLNPGVSEVTRFSATYKRNLNERSAFRFSIIADVIHNDVYYKSPPNDKIILQTDSVIIKQSNVYPKYISPHINLGYERLFGKHKLKWFYGTDISIGYAQNHSYIENKNLFRDTAQGKNAWVELEKLQADIVSKTDKKIFSVGFSPFFGVKYPISKRLSVSAQIGADMTYQNQTISETKGSVKRTYTVSSFDFSENTGILNDMSLIYKF